MQAGKVKSVSEAYNLAHQKENSVKLPHLNSIVFDGQEQAISEMIALALTVAKQQRGQDHLQEYDIIKAKLFTEFLEFEEARATKEHVDVLSEIADLVYYSVQMFAQDADDRDLHETIAHVCKLAHISVEQAYTCALVKYRLRASQPKNIEMENAAIAAALGEGAGR